MIFLEIILASYTQTKESTLTYLKHHNNQTIFREFNISNL